MIVEKKKNNINKVLLITTKGCEGCSILKRLIPEAISMTNVLIESFEIKDVSEIDKSFLKINKVKDFPTTFLIQNDKVKFSFKSTRPAIVIARFIEVHFK